jgi:hypothetical protein
MKTEDRERLGKEAGEIARADTLKHCKAVKLTPRRVLKVIADGLTAMENNVFYDKDRGKCIIGPDLINWKARQKAVDQAISILDMKPAEKHEVDVNGNLADMMRMHLAERKNG